MLKNILMVGIGGFAGSILRFFVSYMYSRWLTIHFPLGTFTVNIMGSFLIGLIFGLAEEYPPFENYRLLLATGFCGGFTTFSAFASENLSLLEKGHIGLALFYMLSSMLLGIIAVFLGIMISKIKM